MRVSNEELKILRGNSWLSEQKEWYVKQGIHQRKSGILVPEEGVGYRVLYEGFPIDLLEEFVLLLKEVIKCRKYPIVNFALRTIWEISFTRIDVHFSRNVDPQKEKKCRLLVILSDYALDKRQFFKRLFDSERNALQPDEQCKISNYLNLSIPIQEEKKYELIKELRKRINSAYNEAHQSITKHPFLDKLDNKIIPSHLSHFLHGDPYSIKGLLETNKVEQEKGVSAMVIKTGINAINRVGETINDSKVKRRIKNLNNKLDSIWKILLTIK